MRGRTIEAFTSAGEKVDRALRAGAMAVGGSVEIVTLPGYMPILNSEEMLEIYSLNAVDLVGGEHVQRLGRRTGSTDMGDVSQIMPVIHPYVSAATGNGHGYDYLVQDYDLAVVTAAKAMAMTVVDLMVDGAQKANRVIDHYDAPLTKDSYLAKMRSMYSEKTYTK